MPRQPSDSELKREFSLHIKALLLKRSAKEIAGVLEVKPQTVYNYRDAKNAPSPEIIRRAMEEWGITLSYRGKTFSLNDFKRKRPITDKAIEQYELWEVIKKLDSQSVQIEILDRKAASVQIGLRIAFRRPK